MSTIANASKIKFAEFFENKFQDLNSRKFIYFFLLFGVILLTFTFNHPIGDFGNYYYGSKFWREGIDPLRFYQDLHFFNSEIRNYETGPFLENYAPVPPFSLIFYWPFTFFKMNVAKLLFSLFCLCFFCFSLERLIKTTKIFSLAFYLLPFIFFQPLYSNFHHGQSYLLITALLFEFYIAWQNDKKVIIGLIVALLFALKTFPAFIAIIFLFKKEWKTLGWIILFTALLQLVVYFVIGDSVTTYYYFNIFPRLALNDITQPFFYFNQSFHTFLLDSFVFHPYLNPSPIVNAPLFAVIIQLMFYSVIFSFFVNVILKQKKFVAFFISVLVLILLNKYSTVYGLIVLVPFIFLLNDIPVKKIILISVILFIACNIPVYKLANFPLILKYSRVWLLIAVFIILLDVLRASINLKQVVLCVVIFISPSLVFYNYETENISEYRPKKGILYDFNLTHEQIKLYTCLGNKDSVEVVNFTLEAKDSTYLRTHSPGYLVNNKTFFLNNNCKLIITDENSGVGIYYLKLVKPIEYQNN